MDELTEAYMRVLDARCSRNKRQIRKAEKTFAKVKRRLSRKRTIIDEWRDYLREKLRPPNPKQDIETMVAEALDRKK